ncbi:MAG TPA: hypothetical protein VK154_01690 [Chitinophagales bacterium]|nr:hypothetical protein [Chitinophagales bacterium]
MKRVAIILLAVFATLFSNAQNKAAFGGINGIYVFNPFDPASPKKPNAKGAVKYKLDRRETGGTWQSVGTYNCPVSESELTNNYHKNYRFVLGKEFTNPNNILRLWQEYNKTPRWDSLAFFFYDRAAALAMCYQFIDTVARTGVSYEYQISELDKSDKVLTSLTTNAVSYPNNNVFTSAPKSSSVEGSQTQAYIVWNQENTSRPVFYRIYRKNGVQGEFEFLQNASNISRGTNSDKFTLEYRDRSVGANQMYFYYAVPCDGFGNTGKASDTVLVKTYETKDILTPQYFIAEKLPGKRGVLLKWRLNTSQSVAGIEVFRSENYDGTFSKIGVASESDTSYSDLTAAPAKIYYYYLQMIDRFQHTSVRTPRTSALFEDTRAPRAPRYLTAGMQGDKVKIQWTTADKEIAGYYVYRSLGHDSAYTLISDFIPAKDSVTTYVDESNDLKSEYGYSYAVTQENTSHVASKQSYPAYLPSQMKASEAPLALHLQVGAGKQGAMLFWDNMQNMNGVIGYIVYKRKKGDGEMKPVSEGMLSASRNFYADTLLELGNVYEYAVQTMMVSGNNSAMSDVVSYTYGDLSVVIPVGLTAAYGETGVELNWTEVDKKRVKEVQVYRAERGGSSAMKLGIVANDKSQYMDMTTTAGKAYYYYLVAIGTDGTESDKSDAVFVNAE